MIPEIIHYCWFGSNPKPKLAKKCIKTWKRYCPDYKIVEWNEDNFDISKCPLYVRQAYELKRWAFVTDYVRLKVVYENGGIYLDTDVEIKKSLDDLLQNKSYFGFEEGRYIATGLGFGAEKGTMIVWEIMQQYENIPFLLENGKIDDLSCPKRNTEIFLKYGLKQDDSYQVLQDGTLILPTRCLCPLSYNTGQRSDAEDTYSIHWFSASWLSKKQLKEHKKEIKSINRKNRTDFITHLPNRIVCSILGKSRYERLKKNLKR
ncbi:MAG: glycosyltransferase [Acutalibacteraceae bacterium]|nr:glycosyltransferase [Acutalibacteraceae bacterium]